MRKKLWIIGLFCVVSSPAYAALSLVTPTSDLKLINSQIEILPVSESGPTHAVAVISPTKGQKVTGIVSFEKSENGLKIVAYLQGLTPGKHGFHIHQFGDIRSADGSKAGGHFNPFASAHGDATASVHHVGDLGNIVADAKGQAVYQATVEGLFLTGSDSIIGRSIVVHASEDDGHSQPAGNSGVRVGQGVIGISQ